MDRYVSLKGWIELDPAALPALRALLAQSVGAYQAFGLTKHAALQLSNGWHVPRGAAGRVHFVFYGAELKQAHVPFVRFQAEQIARAQPDGGAGHPAGRFHLDPLDPAADGAAQVWRCAGGTLHVGPAADAPAR